MEEPLKTDKLPKRNTKAYYLENSTLIGLHLLLTKDPFPKIA